MSEGFNSMPGHLLRRCHQIGVAIFLDDCNEFDLTPLQFVVLQSLKINGPQDQVTLGGETAMDRTTITLLVRKLEERKLLRRKRSTKDQRSKIVSLTKTGEKLLFLVLPSVMQAQQRILAPLNTKESTQLMRLLKKLADGNNASSRAPEKNQSY